MKSCSFKIKGLQGLKQRAPLPLSPQQALVTGISCFRPLPGAGVGVGELIASVCSARRPLSCSHHSHQRGLSLPTGSLKESRELANLSSSFFVWGRRCTDGDLQAKGKCQGADLHVGKMPAGFWYSGGRRRGAEGVAPQQRGNVLTHPAYICLKVLLCFAPFSHVTGYREVLVVSPQTLLLSEVAPSFQLALLLP